MKNRLTTGLAAVSLLAVAGLAAACGSSDDSSASDGGSSAPEKVTVGMSWPYEPWQVGDGTNKGEGAGIEPEILLAIGEKENIDFDIQNVDFTGIITGTQSGKYDLAVSGFGVYGDRLNALNFVPDANTGYTFLLNKADEGKYTDMASICGVKASIGNGTRNASDVEVANGTADPSDDTQEAFAGVCKDNPIKADLFNDQGSQDLAFSTGKDDIEMLTSQVAQSYADKSGGKYVVAEPYAHVYFGIGIPKTDDELSDKIIDGMKAIIEDGTYGQIIDKYKQSEDTKITVDDVKLITE